MFQDRHWNRLKFPTKHVLVCEDYLDQQAAIARHLSDVFEPQGTVQVSYVSGGRAAAGVILWTPIDLVLLDYDMPNGNGQDLMLWLKANRYGMPVITFSGIPQNNVALMALGAAHMFTKADVIAGKADSVIKQILGHAATQGGGGPS